MTDAPRIKRYQWIGGGNHRRKGALGPFDECRKNFEASSRAGQSRSRPDRFGVAPTALAILFALLSQTLQAGLTSDALTALEPEEKVRSRVKRGIFVGAELVDRSAMPSALSYIC